MVLQVQGIKVPIIPLYFSVSGVMYSGEDIYV